MNRLRLLWNAAVTWLACVRATAAEVQRAERMIRSLRKSLRDRDSQHKDTSAEVDALRNEIAELRQSLADHSHEIAKLENERDLLSASLEYWAQWHEKLMERLRAEAAVHTRRRIDAVSGEQPSLAQIVED